MRKLQGKPVCRGVAIGPVCVLRKKEDSPKTVNAENAGNQLERVRTAVREADKELQKLCERANAEAGKEGAAIFAVHRMILADVDYLGAIEEKIRTEHAAAEYAVTAAGNEFYEMFQGMEEAYMRARAEDIRDITDRLLRKLAGREETDLEHIPPSIFCAMDLTPSETIQIGREKILGFVTVRGSEYSHTAILAKMMNIPALVGVPMELDEIENGTEAVLDGISGEFFCAPTAEVRAMAKQKQAHELELQRLLGELKGKDNVTRSGYRMEVCANIGSVEDISLALEKDAGGIGLLRSEFLYLGRAKPPAEEEQFQAYRSILQRMGEKPVVIRTLDIGADKSVEYLNLGEEENPALGCRGIRVSLRYPQLFQTQLRALLRAAVFGNLSILYPMISSVEEVECILKMVRSAVEELSRGNYSCRIPRQGIMIETPAAVMLSEELAQTVDFFSIGTNDLEQYTLASDRRNEVSRDYFDVHHTAVLRMVRMAADNAHKFGKRVSVCGELGGDLSLTEEFVRMGIDELSVSPSMVLPIRKKIRELD